MTAKYFFLTKILKQKKGPFTKDDLIGKVSPNTMVWSEGMETWKKASEVEDLSGILIKIPPPTREIPNFIYKLKRLIHIRFTKRRKLIEIIKVGIILLFFFMTFGGPWVVSLSVEADTLAKKFRIDQNERKIEIQKKIVEEKAQRVQMHNSHLSRIESLEREIAWEENRKEQAYNNNRMSDEQRRLYELGHLTMRVRSMYTELEGLKTYLSAVDPYRAVQMEGFNPSFYNVTSRTIDYDRKVDSYNYLCKTAIYASKLPKPSSIAFQIFKEGEIPGQIAREILISNSLICTLASMLLLYFMRKRKISMFKKIKSSATREFLDLVPFISVVYITILIVVNNY